MNENIINYMNNIENTNLYEEDKEFEKYLKLFKERFGRNAYIAEPNGNKRTNNRSNQDLFRKE